MIKICMFSDRWGFKDDGRRLPGDADGALAVGQLRGHAGNVDGSSGLKNSTHTFFERCARLRLGCDRAWCSEDTL